MRKLVKTGDLVTIHSFKGGLSWYHWCKIILITVDEKDFNEYLIITGESELNTVCKIKIKRIGESFGNYWMPESTRIKSIPPEEIIISNAHDIHFPKLVRITDGISLMRDNLKWIEGHGSREDKLKKLGI